MQATQRYTSSHVGQSSLPSATRPTQCRSHVLPRARTVLLQAMQSGWNPQQQQQQQQPMQQPMQQQPQQMPPAGQQQPRQPMPLARSPSPYHAAGPVFLDLTQVLNKQVITRTSGRCLGTISGAWLDPAAGTLVSFDLDERKQGGSGALGGLSTPPRAGNIPLSALRQIGDVVLVHDESGLYEQDLDGRLGFVNPVGLDVRTRAGEFLGKVRDLSFSPDSGAIRRITYDEFGLPFLPISFFDCYSVSMQDVISIGRGDLLVYDDAKYRERKESAGLFAAIPSLFKSLNGPSRSGSSGGQLALPAPGGTSDMYRLGGPGSTSGTSGSSSSRFLPTDYTYEQWQADLRRWEAETGMTYEQYLRAQSQQPGAAAAAPRTALPPGRSGAAGGGYGAAGYGAQQQYNPAQQQPQPQQPGYMQPQQPQPMYQQQPGQAPAWQQQQQQQGMPQQQQYAARPAGGQQQYPGAMGQQGGYSPNPAGLGPSRYAGAQAGQQGYGAAVPQQPQQQPQQQRAAAGQPGQQQQQQQRPQQQSAAGQTRAPMQQQQQVSRSMGAAGAAPRSPPATQQQQQQPAGAASTSQAAGAPGRPVNDWMERETRPRIADALADGVLPSSADAPAAPMAAAASNGQSQQQEVA